MSDTWEELGQLKTDIAVADDRIGHSERHRKQEAGSRKLMAEQQTGIGVFNSGGYIMQPPVDDPYTSPLLQRVLPPRAVSTSHWASPPQWSSREPRTNGVCTSPVQVPRKRIPGLSVGGAFTKWPTEVDGDADPMVVHLNYGLLSPPSSKGRSVRSGKTSPHRVIDRPDKDTSPSKWVSLEAAPRQLLRAAPDFVNGSNGVLNVGEPWSRPASQNTYLVTRSPEPAVSCNADPLSVFGNRQVDLHMGPHKKTTFLQEYNPASKTGDLKTTILQEYNPASKTGDLKTTILQEYNPPHKTGDLGAGDAGEWCPLPSSTIVRRPAQTKKHDANVVKVMPLTELQDKIPKARAEKKKTVSHTEKKRKKSVADGDSANLGAATETTGQSKPNIDIGTEATEGTAMGTLEDPSKTWVTLDDKMTAVVTSQISAEPPLDLYVTKELDDKMAAVVTSPMCAGASGLEGGNIVSGVEKMIADLERVLHPEGTVKETADSEHIQVQQIQNPAVKDEVTVERKSVSRHRTTSTRRCDAEKKPETETGPLKKRTTDVKVAQDFIKAQKQKRAQQRRQAKLDKEKGETEKQKKLEMLRVKTLELAAVAARNAKPATDSMKTGNATRVVEADADADDCSVSLGLRQLKPRLSYNQLVLNMKRGGDTSREKEYENPAEAESKTEDVRGSDGAGQLLETKKKTDAEVEETVAPAMHLIPEPLQQPVVQSILPEPIAATSTTADYNRDLMKLCEIMRAKMERMARGKTPSTGKRSSVKGESPPKATSTGGRSSVGGESPPKAASGRARTNVKAESPSKSDGRQTGGRVTVDARTIATLRQEIQDMAHNFHTLHDFIIESRRQGSEPGLHRGPVVPVVHEVPEASGQPESVPSIPRFPSGWAHNAPYNVLSAARDKLAPYWRTSTPKESVTSLASSLAKYESDFETASMSAHPKEASSEEHDFTMINDSSSDLSSSILDYRESPKKTLLTTRDSPTSSNFTIVTDGLSLSTPELKLVPFSVQPLEELNKSKTAVAVKDLNVSITLAAEESSEHSTIVEMIDNQLESDKSVTLTNTLQGKTHQARYQEVLDAVETMEKRAFVLMPSRVDGKKNEKVVNKKSKEMARTADHSVQTSEVGGAGAACPSDGVQLRVPRNEKTDTQERHSKKTKTESALKSESTSASVNTELESSVAEDVIDDAAAAKKNPSQQTKDTADSTVKTELDQSAVTTIRTELDGSVDSERSTSVKEITSHSEEVRRDSYSSRTRKDSEALPSSETLTGVSLEMLNQLIKEEELRSEHQLALIKLRERTLKERVTAELKYLETRKRALKEKPDGKEEHNISTIKKKQRGILLKYQSEEEEIARLRRMHRIAAEERNIILKQQQKLQKAQLSTKDMLNKLERMKRRWKSPGGNVRGGPIKSLGPARTGNQVCSLDQSLPSDLDLTCRSLISDGEEEILLKNRQTLEERIARGAEKMKKCQKYLGEHEKKLVQRRNLVEEILEWKTRLEEEERRLREMEKQAMMFPARTRPVRDVSTSPLQVLQAQQEAPFEGMSSSISEAIQSETVSNTTVIQEELDVSVDRIGVDTDKDSGAPAASSAGEDIPEELSLPSRTAPEYNSESFESLSGSEAPSSQAVSRSVRLGRGAPRKTKAITIKVPLSPRTQPAAYRRRYSSASEESLNFSHTETASEQSDVESRITALEEQLRRRKLEAGRLRKEEKKIHRERLVAKEQSLLKQLKAYDSYIHRVEQDLEQNSTVVKPLIKQPKVAEKGKQTEDKEKLHPNVTARRKDRTALAIERYQSDSDISESIKEIDDVKEVSESVKSKDDIEEAIEAESNETAADEVATENTSESINVSEVLDEVEEENRDSSTVKEIVSESEEVTETMVDVSEDVAEGVSSIAESESVPEELEDEPKTKELEPRLGSDAEMISEGEESENETPDSSSVKTTLSSPEKRESGTAELAPEEIPDQEETSAELDKEYKETYSSDSFESDAEKDKSKTESKEPETAEDLEGRMSPEGIEAEDEADRRVDAISESILMRLLNESLSLYQERRQQGTADRVAAWLMKDLLRDSMDQVLGPYVKSMAAQSPQQVTPDVRRRIHEIMLTGSARDGVRPRIVRPQDMMVTTYGLSPQNTSPTLDGDYDGQNTSELSPLTNSGLGGSKVHVQLEVQAADTSPDADPYNQDWFEDDFGLSRTRRAEEEKLKLIEQEIKELQAQQDAFYFIREIPNKPPPPYTPPGGLQPTEKPLPSSEAAVTELMTDLSVGIWAQLQAGVSTADLAPPPSLRDPHDSDVVRCYNTFLFDLAKQVTADLTREDLDRGPTLPWHATAERLVRHCARVVPRTLEAFTDALLQQTLLLFGMRQKVAKEGLIVRWSRKKRDHVDELLVSESQTEEAQWTRYDEEEVIIKNEIADAILDALLADTVAACGEGFRRRAARK